MGVIKTDTSTRKFRLRPYTYQVMSKIIGIQKLILEASINAYYTIDTDEIPGFFLLLKNHIFIARSEDTIFIFHV